MRKFFLVLLLVIMSVALLGCAIKLPKAESENNLTENGINNTIVDFESHLTAGGGNEAIEIPEVPETNVEDENELGSENNEGQDESLALETKAVYVRAKVSGLNVRSGKGTSFSTLGSIDKGDMLAYLGEEDGWYKTYYRSQTAYVSAKPEYTELYTMATGDEETENIISVGLKLLGTPYVYGAVRYHNGAGKKLSNFTIDEFDCSSLMQYMAYMGANKLLDLTTRTQIMQGEKVVGELKRGDLMFFTNASRQNKTGIERVGHVAMYLGDNYILHTASDYAVIEEISATRWSYFIQANRI